MGYIEQFVNTFKKDMKMRIASKDQILEAVKKMSVKELTSLVADLETELNSRQPPKESVGVGAKPKPRPVLPSREVAVKAERSRR